ncbi:MAG: flagellar biosynthesis protein FlgJ [Alphaproteobacteria bacterium]|jgi:flagellar basal-body rod modification protein FlgD|nr:flagellar biosynthesis protein FlgJ [Alphaproteobacteria bacterium]
MSTIDPTSQAQLDSILKKIGVNNEGDTKKANKDTLGQSDFLKLMTTQLQNQDPFAPMENAEFIAQMAQFSTVTGITDMNTTLASMADQLGEFRIATAANLLGSSVMIPGNYARPDETGEIHGMLDLPSASGITNLTFSNTAGDVLHQMELGAQPAGLVGFSWTDLPDSVLASGDAVRIEAFADMGKGMESLTPSVFAEILAASTGDAATGVMLDVRDYGEVRAADVSKFRR